MKTLIIKIKQYTFLNPWEIEYQIGKEYFVMAIEKEELRQIFGSEYLNGEYKTPQDFLETDEDVEKLITWFHTDWEHKDHIEPMDLQFSKLYKPKKKQAKEVTFKTNLKQIGTTPATIEMTNPAYIQAIVERLERMEREVQKLKAENKRKDDILLTTKMIEMNYQISAKTINQARVHNRIVGRKINGKEWGYERREVERYLENSKGYFKNPPQQYVS
ncbi:hypothetical protein ACE193_21315 [Bernardetia sp. OM2101]|uniref:hypothetical protein n=1 Tax=Bernardetia sp. OM2101 TaxID=3344876 RepID=UPI0035CF576B